MRAERDELPALTLADVLQRLGPNLITVAAVTGAVMQRSVSGVVIYDRLRKLDRGDGHVLLAVGVDPAASDAVDVVGVAARVVSRRSCCMRRRVSVCSCPRPRGSWASPCSSPLRMCRGFTWRRCCASAWERGTARNWTAWPWETYSASPALLQSTSAVPSPSRTRNRASWRTPASTMTSMNPARKRSWGVRCRAST